MSLDRKLLQFFPDKIVKKDLARRMKTTSNIPSFVLEFLISLYCKKDNIDEDLNKVRSILFYSAQSSRSEVTLTQLRKRGSITIMDRVCVRLDLKKNVYLADLSILGYEGISIPEKYPEQYSRLLTEGIWCVIKLQYYHGQSNGNASVISIIALAPMQVPNINLQEFIDRRQHFTKEEWIDLIIRSCGIEPNALNVREKWLMLLRLVPLCEPNYNLCELGPRSTGKSYLYKEVSSYSILVSGGQSSASNLFYNQSTHVPGLVASWDCVAFDEVAGIQLKDKDGLQIMKDYMASGSFVRGRHAIVGNASMVFVGNIDEISDDVNLFSPFPATMAYDTAFLDRIHAYLPGWELPKLSPRNFSSNYGFFSDYLGEILRAMRQLQYGDIIDRYFQLGNTFNQRDTIAVRKTVSGLIKLIDPGGNLCQEDLTEILTIAIEMRQRVREQLHKVNSKEFSAEPLIFFKR